MPSLFSSIRRGRKPWRAMARWERKNWYRDQQTRVSRGLPPLPKP